MKQSLGRERMNQLEEHFLRMRQHPQMLSMSLKWEVLKMTEGQVTRLMVEEIRRIRRASWATAGRAQSTKDRSRHARHYHLFTSGTTSYEDVLRYVSLPTDRISVTDRGELVELLARSKLGDIAAYNWGRCLRMLLHGLPRTRRTKC